MVDPKMILIDEVSDVPEAAWDITQPLMRPRQEGKTFAMLQQKQFAVREAVNKAVRAFVGRALDDKLRWEIATAAQEAGKKAAKQFGIRPPKVVVDRDKKDPSRIAVRIAFPLGGRL